MSLPELVTIHTSLLTDLADAVRGRWELSGTMTLDELTDTIKNALPPKYTRLKAVNIKSGSNYINTGIKLNGSMEVEYIYKVTTPKSYGPHILSGYNYFMPFVRGTSSTNRFLCKYSGTETGHDIASPYSDYIHIKSDFAHGKMLINDVEYSVTIPSSPSTDSSNAYIGNYGAGAGTDFSLLGEMVSLKIWENGTLLRNFIPAERKSDNYVGYFEEVTETFYAYGTQANVEAVYNT